MLRIALAALLGAAMSLAASAATTTLDTTFAPVFASPATVRAMAPMANGQVVVGGDFVSMNGTGANRVARINTDGTTDTTFRVAADIQISQVNAVAVQADGKVLVGGQLVHYGETLSRSYLLRLNADGSLDTTFAAGGYNFASATGYGLDNAVSAIAIDGSGRIVVGGLFLGPQHFVARLNADGSADPTFTPGTGPNNQVTHVALQSGGRIVIGGAFTAVNGTPKSGVAMLESTGAVVAAAFGTGVSGGSVLALAVQPDNRVLVGGDFNMVNGSPTSSLMARFDAGGTHETAFVPANVGNLQAVTALAATSTHILVGGWYSFIIFNGYPTDHQAQVYVVQSSDGGWVNYVDFAGKPTDILAFAKRPDGSVAFGGSFTNLDGDPTAIVAGIGLMTAGTTPSLSDTWRPKAGGRPEIRTLARQADGKLVVGGSFYMANGAARAGLARINADGSLDATLAPPNLEGGTVAGAVVREDGKIVMGGNMYRIAGNDNIDIALLSSTGTYEAGAYAGNVTALAAYPGGKVVAGLQYSPGVRRLTSALAVEDSTTFNPGSGTSSAIQGDGEIDRVNAVAVQGDGKILVAGSFSTFSGAAHSDIVRLNADGTIDSTFASPGFTVFSFRHEIFALAVQADGKILVAGRFSTVGGLPRPTVARLNANGSVDTSFVTPFSNSGATAYSLLLQADGRIVVGGNLQVLEGSAIFNSLVRLNPDGSRDRSLGTSVTGHVRALLEAPGASGARLLLAGGSIEAADAAARAGLVRYATPRTGKRGDVNGDGKADLFWREPAPGTGLAWWTMDGNAATGFAYFPVPAEWQVADVGDLDGDGRTDLVWQRASDGATYLWRLDGLVPVGFADLGIVPPSQWTLVGAADFNGDGRSDLLWRRNADGALYVWLMSNGTIIGQGSPATVDLSWEVADLADMDGDGRADLVWRRPSDGAVAVWYMNGTSSTGGGTVATLDPSWQVVAAEDFNGDGRADILWRSSGGDTWVWLMDGTTVLSAAGLGNPGLSWSIQSVADLDGDGKADIVWRHADGTTYLWKMNGSAVSSYLPIANPGGTWQIVAP